MNSPKISFKELSNTVDKCSLIINDKTYLLKLKSTYTWGCKECAANHDKELCAQMVKYCTLCLNAHFVEICDGSNDHIIANAIPFTTDKPIKCVMHEPEVSVESGKCLMYKGNLYIRIPFVSDIRADCRKCYFFSSDDCDKLSTFCSEGAYLLPAEMITIN